MKPHWLWIVVSLIALFDFPAHAETVSIAGVSLVVEPPPGYCALDANSGDGALF
jgi:hypothetical protein